MSEGLDTMRVESKVVEVWNLHQAISLQRCDRKKSRSNLVHVFDKFGMLIGYVLFDE